MCTPKKAEVWSALGNCYYSIVEAMRDLRDLDHLHTEDSIFGNDEMRTRLRLNHPQDFKKDLEIYSIVMFYINLSLIHS